MTPCVDGDDQVRTADSHGRFTDQVGVLHRCRHDRDLVRAGIEKIANVLERADAPAHRERHEDRLRRARPDV